MARALLGVSYVFYLLSAGREPALVLVYVMQIYKEGGLRALYRGSSAGVARIAIGSAVQLAS